MRKKAEEKLKNIQKSTRGITLIALVVTIVVLLILAGVTITMVLGEDGIIAQAKLAAEKTKEAEEKQDQDLKNLVEQLDKILEEEPTPQEPETTPGKTAKDLTENNYGDYVDYGININGNDKTTDDWRIFYVGEGEVNGKKESHIFLIASDYVPYNCSALQTAIDQDHANMTRYTDKENWETYYWKNSSDAVYNCYDGKNRMSWVDISKSQCSFPDLFMSTKYYCSNHVMSVVGDNENARYTSALQCTDNWSSFVNESNKSTCALYAIGGPTIEMWMASWNSIHGENSNDEKKQEVYFKGEEDKSSKYGYSIGKTPETDVHSDLGFSSTTGFNDTLYFPHNNEYEGLELDGTNDKNETCHGYWLSSPSGSSGSYGTELFYVNYSGSINTHHGYFHWIGIRPVVCLKSNVKLTEKEDNSGGNKVWDLSM